ncbi:EAL domain-containing protein [Bacillus sp. FJAT-45350]|uniref:EAL domain-containing protein n=1 Tax=Bacillus sp. FJAT-45350 TaxID=2011014 RepID=UPI000BB87160|nr:EAL domain-containing protein [Bacillus sp. FJAT-45350]
MNNKKGSTTKFEINSETKLQLETVLENTFDGIIIHDKGKVIKADDTFLGITGYKLEEIVNRSFFDFVAPTDKERVKKLLQMGVQQESHEFVGMKKDGTNIYFKMKSSPYPLKGSIVQMISLQNITQSRLKDERIEFLAFYDDLTGLPNKVLFNRRLSLAMTYAQLHNQNLAVMFCDCDGFKKINSTLGNQVGDSLLVQVSKRLKGCLSENVTLSRNISDEFTILLPNVNQQEAELVAEKIVAAFREPFEIDGSMVYLTMSIGISLYPLHGNNAESLVQQADTATYEVKRSGRSNYKFYTPTMSHQNFNLFTIENELRNAIKKEDFLLYYQPQIEVKAGKIIGVEALIRWHHTELGAISPAKFIPIAEKSGLILPIGEWVLQTACLQNQSWIDQGFTPLKMSVNFTAKQFQQPNIVDKIKEILNETRLDPTLLEIEITEIAALGTKENVIDCFQSLKELGVKVNIDDFGTGYCSFDYLKKFPINKLKIDRSFIQNISENTDNQAITEAIIRMGKGLGLSVIAEGVETEEELAYLKQLDCDEVQGYYYSKPLSHDDIERYLTKNNHY